MDAQKRKMSAAIQCRFALSSVYRAWLPLRDNFTCIGGRCHHSLHWMRRMVAPKNILMLLLKLQQMMMRKHDQISHKIMYMIDTWNSLEIQRFEAMVFEQGWKFAFIAQKIKVTVTVRINKGNEQLPQFYTGCLQFDLCYESPSFSLLLWSCWNMLH